MRRSFGIVLGVLIAAGLVWSGGCPGVGTGGTFNLPPVPVIGSDVTRGVAPLTVSFNSDQSTDDGLIVLRQWNFGDGATSQDIRPRHTYTTTGDFTVRLTLTDDLGATASRSIIVSVTQAPVAVIKVDRTSADAAPAVINFDASDSFDADGRIVSYRWDFGDGSTEVVPVVAHTYARPGTFRARLTVVDDKGITGTADVLISINIRTPSIEIRTPPAHINNIVVETGSPLWIHGVFNVETGVPYTVRAGVDGDRDVCDAQCVLLSAETLAVTGRLEGHRDRVSGADFGPGDVQVISSSRDGTLRLYDVTSAGLDKSYNGVGEILCVDFAPDGASFAYGQANGRAFIRERATGDTVRELSDHTAAVNSVEFSAAGNRLLTASNDRRALLYDAVTGALLQQFAHDLAVNDAAISPDGALVATAGEDGVAKLWNAESGALLATFSGHGAPVNAIAFSHGGTLLASGGDDNAVRVWDLAGAQVGVLNGHTDDVISVAFSPDDALIVSGGADAFVRVWDRATFAEARKTQVCASPVVSVAFSSDGLRILAGVAARNAIQLDTDPPSGNDLPITYPQALRLDSVASLGGASLPEGVYFLWAEIDTDRTEPVRTYANPIIQVVAPFTATVEATTPRVPLFNDAAAVVVSPAKIRQVMDLGPLAQGDRLFLSLLNTPGFGEQFTLARDYSLYILDADQSIYAWYQPGFILFNSETKMVIGHSSPHYYIVTDGGNSVNVRIQRNANLFETRPQRVFVRFDGGVNIAAGPFPGQNISPLSAADFNQFFNTNPNFTDPADTVVLEQVIMQTLRNVYDGFNVQFTGTNESPTPPALPYKTIYVGGSAPGQLAYGIADYINPRNDTHTGTAITYALTVGEGIIDNPFVANPVLSGNPSQALNDLGFALGQVTAHEIGHLLGLRHTGDGTDIMQGSEGTGSGDPTVPRTLKSAAPAAFEQIDLLPVPIGPDVPPIGIQNAPQYLSETVGG